MTIGKKLASLPETLEVHYIDGGDGYFIKLRVANHQELGNFIREKIGTIEHIYRTKTCIALTSLKETSRIPLPMGG
jgi:DNA-binding Lrp family transcriptional regulator